MYMHFFNQSHNFALPTVSYSWGFLKKMSALLSGRNNKPVIIIFRLQSCFFIVTSCHLKLHMSPFAAWCDFESSVSVEFELLL